MMALHFKHEVLYCEYVNKQEFSGVLRQVLRKVSLYARAHAYEYANIDITQLPESFKGTDISGESLLQPTRNSNFKNASYRYNLLFTMK